MQGSMKLQYSDSKFSSKPNLAASMAALNLNVVTASGGLAVENTSHTASSGLTGS